jgi:hypothetical protein
MVKLYHKDCPEAGKMGMRELYVDTIIEDGLVIDNPCPLIGVMCQIVMTRFPDRSIEVNHDNIYWRRRKFLERII